MTYEQIRELKKVKYINFLLITLQLSERLRQLRNAVKKRNII